MGPYCNFCGQRCFIPLPGLTPAHILRAYGSPSMTVATCPGGKRFEKGKVGYSLDDIRSWIEHLPRPLESARGEA